jgi:hypothetical protein
MCGNKNSFEYFSLSYFSGIQLPSVFSMPEGWIVVSLWEQGYLRCFCNDCSIKFKNKVKEIGVE